ncbi:MAG: hypothetical protein WCP86_04510 [bacterium]
MATNASSNPARVIGAMATRRFSSMNMSRKSTTNAVAITTISGIISITDILPMQS